ncbi:MAG: oligosaccharide flippase family protein, partial [SAR202 cluster bacterium]|nr:oligosaccharide flippase family protein [SAR202 cluster bacterium]
FFTRYLTPNDYGVLAVYWMFGGITTNLLSLGLQSSTIRYYYKEKDNLTYFGTLNFTNFIFIFGMFIIGGIVVWFTSKSLAQFLFDGKISENVIILSYFGGCIANLSRYLKELLIPQQRSKAYSILTVFSSIFSSGIAVILILAFSMTYYSRIYSSIINDFIIFIIAIFLQIKYFQLNWSNSSLKKSIVFSYPQIPQQIISLVHTSFDKIMLTNIKGLTPVGHYHIAQRFGGIIKTFISTITRAWSPFFFHKAELNTHQAKEEIVERYYEIIMIFNFFCIIITCFSEEAVKLLTTEEFYPSMYIVPLVVFYILFTHTLSIISKLQVFFAEKMIYTLPPSITALIINIILNIILIPKFGAVGAVLATVAASIVSSIMLFYISQKLYPLPIEYGKLINQLMML